MKKIIIVAGVVLSTVMYASCNSSENKEQRDSADSTQTTQTQQQDQTAGKGEPSPNKADCSFKITLPDGCRECPDDDDCKKKIATAHRIPYDTFKKAIANYHHRASSKIDLAYVKNKLKNISCSTHRIKMDGKHDVYNSNEDITLEPEEFHGVKAYYEIPFFEGLILLKAQQMYFYKGETNKNETVCKDILVEVQFADSFRYYDLSDSEDQ